MAKHERKRKNNEHKHKSNEHKNKFSFKKFIAFILYISFFIAITSPFYVLYGPFQNVKKTLVGMVWGSRHRYLVEMFLSKDKIQSLVGSTKTAETKADEDIEKINIQHKNDNEIIKYEINDKKFDGYLLEIKDPTRIKIAYTKYSDRGQKTSEMAKERNAVAAINGGSFVDKNYAGVGSTPGGFVISNGQVIYKDCDEDTPANVIAFTKEGKLIVGDHSINELKACNVTEAVCFLAPTLIIDGKKQIDDPQCDGANPRTAVGQRADGTVLFLVTDGRKNLVKLGASLYDLQKILYDHGAINAGRLDGGYSSTMYYEGEVINSPNEWDGERTVPTALYVEPEK
ncbi:phosphodiester glycosidase family protein [Clostridium sp. JS66]|uniref:phosphodiester glycosidase family protein n=1 Tax=Clostridium sp. JS66 TaxID=3064705 RepID=UPI00298E5A48|nr:phosphodiester glycosidase family protein [Clostridium sp. JS66]WPC43514.1 phosphodiester glycosidase family protein [Clostridium sp. JS66]